MSSTVPQTIVAILTDGFKATPWSGAAVGGGGAGEQRQSAPGGRGERNAGRRRRLGADGAVLEMIDFDPAAGVADEDLGNAVVVLGAEEAVLGGGAGDAVVGKNARIADRADLAERDAVLIEGVEGDRALAVGPDDAGVSRKRAKDGLVEGEGDAGGTTVGEE